MSAIDRVKELLAAATKRCAACDPEALGFRRCEHQMAAVRDLREYAVPIAEELVESQEALKGSTVGHIDIGEERHCTRIDRPHMHRGVDCDEPHPCDCKYEERTEARRAALHLKKLEAVMEEK